MIRYAFVALALAIQQCPPPPSPPAQDASPPVPVPLDAAPRDGGTTVYQRACTTLASLGCAEGAADNCVATLERAQAARIADMHPDCLSRANTKAEARSCGSVSCP